MVCVTTRGGDYSGPGAALDFVEPYLRTIFGFVGITDTEFVNAQPLDVSPDLTEAAMAAAHDRLRTIATGADWSGHGTVGAGTVAG